MSTLQPSVRRKFTLLMGLAILASCAPILGGALQDHSMPGSAAGKIGVLLMLPGLPGILVAGWVSILFGIAINFHTIEVTRMSLYALPVNLIFYFFLGRKLFWKTPPSRIADELR